MKFAGALRAIVEPVQIDGHSDLKVTARLAVVTAAVHIGSLFGGAASTKFSLLGWLRFSIHDWHKLHAATRSTPGTVIQRSNSCAGSVFSPDLLEPSIQLDLSFQELQLAEQTP
jgi:hypothetical protein